MLFDQDDLDCLMADFEAAEAAELERARKIAERVRQEESFS
jgi:hypothetical protein